ncbi:sensor histidine kinase [Chryseolinea lacunae]|uniref:histidine kinase n=1 Tax=Chryseolinea lacunae TaxID=2801331 RepID=A0ABS1KUV9_9BACT|nr:PAS domain-containing sensor histidine kinase [Chryseolinea lacunae]MBL0743251.1 PAS domain S-box protein [Chryseolinea lacunae]
MENEGMFRELIENSDDIIIVTDKEFRIRYISSSVHKVFDVEPVSMLRRNIFDFVAREKQESWKHCLDETPHSVVDEVEFKVQHGEKRYFDVHVSNLLDHYKVQGLVLKLHDITQTKQKQEELLRSNQQLDQVIYKTTHDLKAPLMSALGLVKIAETAPIEEKDRYISMIKKSLLKLDSYIEEMNNFFRNDKLALQREKINLNELLASELENLKNLHHGDRVKVSLQGNSDIAWYSDLIRVKTVVANIFSNAIKYQDLQKQNPFIKIVANVTEEFCDICIEDNGIGIDPEYKEKIFDLFFRGTDQSQGTGLGLFIVKDTIERLKGTIEVRSEKGKGTAFRIRIPNQLHQSLEVE